MLLTLLHVMLCHVCVMYVSCMSCVCHVQSVRPELIEKEEPDNTGLESLLEGDQESYFLSTASKDKGCGKHLLTHWLGIRKSFFQMPTFF